MADTFYDKSIKLLSYTEEVDDEGWVTVETDSSTTFKGNVRFDNLAQIQEDFGLDEEIDIVITTNESISLGNILEYDGVTYRVTSAIPYDTHKLITGKKWLTEPTSLTSPSA